MADEAVIIELHGDEGDVVQYNCLATDTFTKGQLLVMSGSAVRFAKASAADGDFFAGICSADKAPTSTTPDVTGAIVVGVYTKGIFDIKTTASPLVSGVGDPVKISGANLVEAADDDTIENSKEVVGYLQEPVAGGVQDTVSVIIGSSH